MKLTTKKYREFSKKLDEAISPATSVARLQELATDANATIRDTARFNLPEKGGAA